MNYFAILFMALVAQLLPVASIAADSSNETLFDQCKTYQRYKSGKDNLTQPELFKANSCVHYLAGAFQMHNLSSGEGCIHSKKTIDQFVNDYVDYSRKGGGYLDQPQQIVVWYFLESCYCGKNDAIMRANCPALK